MTSTPVRSAPSGLASIRPGLRVRGWIFGALAACGFVATGNTARAQDGPEAPIPEYAKKIIKGESLVNDPAIQQASCCGNVSPAPMITGSFGGGCSSCGGGGGDSGCNDGCGSNKCKPGKRCGTCNGLFDRPGECGCVGKVFGSIFDCICCTDPCYEPCWSPAANAAFFVDHARPQSQMLLRWDNVYGMTQPDRNEYFWAKRGKGPGRAERRLDYQELTYYNETAVGGFGISIEMPYRSLHPEINSGHSGFSDLKIGTKSMFVDCELMQLTFGFKTYVPIGSPGNGLGTGHVSLEPSLLATFKLAQKTFIEAQISEWIPIAGDTNHAGLTLHYHTSLNHSWCKRGPFELVGSMEFNGWTFQDGQVTNFDGTNDGMVVKSNRETYLSAGPGARLHFCENYDVGVGTAFALTDDNFGDQIYRLEFRLRY